MALIACPVPGKEKSHMLCEAFIAGAPKTAQGFVFYGVKAGNHEQWIKAQSSGQDWYFIDNSYFDKVRGRQFRVAKNRLQHDGWGISDGKRFHALQIPILSRKMPPAGSVLIIPQSEDHMKFVLEHADLKKWLMNVRTRWPNAKVREWNANKPVLVATLREELIRATMLVTHTSAAAVEAVLLDVPMICDPLCAAWEFSQNNPEGARLTSMEHSFIPRYRWATVLADNQWTIDEMKGGLAWRTLNP